MLMRADTLEQPGERSTLQAWRAEQRELIKAHENRHPRNSRETSAVGSAEQRTEVTMLMRADTLGGTWVKDQLLANRDERN
jgi:hypothetical protein